VKRALLPPSESGFGPSADVREAALRRPAEVRRALAIKWGVDSRGRMKIESKDDMRKRGLP
jgi:hypothetical protein